jgi:Domain of unknown function (DUF1995)
MWSTHLSSGNVGVSRCNSECPASGLSTSLCSPSVQLQRRLHCRKQRSQNQRSQSLLCKAAAQEQAETTSSASSSKASGRETYRPESFQELVQDATDSIVAALQKGLTKLEVEFPPLPSNVDSAYVWQLSPCSVCNFARSTVNFARSTVKQTPELATALACCMCCRLQRGFRRLHRC